MCAVSAWAPMGTDFGNEMNNWPTSVSTTSLQLTCSHAVALLQTPPPDATFFSVKFKCDVIPFRNEEYYSVIRILGLTQQM